MINMKQIQKIFWEMNERLENAPLLISVRKGLTLMIPLILIGSFALILSTLPVPGYQILMEKFLGRQWRDIFFNINSSTFNILSLLMVLCTSYSYAAEYGERYGKNVNPMIVASVSLCSFIAILARGKNGFSQTNFGVIGVFVAILVAFTSAKLFLKLGSLKLLKIKAFANGANSTFSYAVTSIYPAAITITAFAIINQILTAGFGIFDLQNFISNTVGNLFSQIKSPFWNAVLLMLLIHIFWFLGMHGSNILEPVIQRIFTPKITAYVLLGGCGAVLCLICAILITGRYKNQLRLAKLSLLPVIFNISELMVFGIPIVLNPIYLIPFLFIPIILTGISYLAMHFGIVPYYPANFVEWPTPIFLSGFITSNSINGILLQLFNLTVGTLCYIPFVKLEEKISNTRMKNNFGKVYDLYRQNEQRGVSATLLARHDEIGNISRFLAADLEHDLQNNKVALFYQPQVDYEGNVIGVEALLRWKHDSYGYIYPPLAIALAEESQLIETLGYWILDTACNDLKKMNKLGFKNITVSINVSTLQLESASFIKNLEEIISKHRVKPDNLQIEITEQLALSNSRKLINQILSVKKAGVKLAMDDFGMGHSSLMYLKEYNFDTIKLDGSLVREILFNNNCSNIISSIVFLGKSLNYSVVAEYVENERQKRVLHELGCNQYQGYLFNKALPYNEIIEYMLNSKQHQLSQGTVL
ncbi:MAG: EAL domain-containing protein [Bacillota bacterium]|jgi:cellobiose-specific phosphotransferase system component IIC/EAL domain-containing protein (putative c-di-GMP-specific phosphodiesterase class I)